MGLNGERRAVSNVVGVVILVAVVLSGATLVAGFSATALSDRTDTAIGAAAATDLTELGEGIETVVYSARDRRRVAVGGSDSTRGYQLGPVSDGRLSVAIGSDAAGWSQVADVRLGALAAEVGDETVAYQGGGVWRVAGGDRTGVEVVRAPPISVVDRGSTSIVLPVFVIGEGAAVTGDALVSQSTHRRLYPPLSVPNGSAVRITVTSRFASGWATVFERAFPAARTRIDLDRPTHTVTVTCVPDRGEALFLHGGVHRIDVGPA